MPFILNHVLGSGRLTPVKRQDGTASYFHVSGSGTLVSPHPGVVYKSAVAQFRYRMHTGQGTHGGFQTTIERFPITLQIFTPDGQEFTRPEITTQDLARFRDLRGVPAGNWTWTLLGDSRHVEPLNEGSIAGEGMLDAECSFSVTVEEHVASESAGPLIANAPVTGANQRFSFDLFRVGTFVATISHPASLLHPWHGTMRLLDPDGNAVAATTGQTLSFPVDLRLLDRSRDAAGHTRTWTLELPAHGGVVVGLRLNATVIAHARTTTAAIQSRIDKLLGLHGSFIKLYGVNNDGRVAVRFVDTDVVSAETLDMHDVLKNQLKKYKQISPALDDEIHADIIYTLADLSENLDHGITVKAGSMKVASIDLTVGPGVRLGAGVPAARLVVTTVGELEFEFAGVKIGSASITNGTLEVEIGVQLSPDGMPTMATWFPDNPFHIEFSWEVILSLILVTGPLIALGEPVVRKVLENYANDTVVTGARGVFADPTMAPRFLMMILGGHFDHRAIRTEGQDWVFDYVAPTEPDPRPGEAYHGVIGRSYQPPVGANAIRFQPVTLGDTWKNSNLSRIKHIVVVMMENRSYDHVLGYRAGLTPKDGSDGLTQEMVDAIEATAPPNTDPQGPTAYVVANLHAAGFLPDDAQLMTQLPHSVAHEFEDVAQQLGGGKILGPGNRTINSPRGFYDSLSKRLADPLEAVKGVKAMDALGYYDAHELPFYAYLAEHYAYCDRYFCSHPGPTLPNRMFSLSGDLQHSRIGVPLMNNNDGDEFLLSRALTIYDFLTRKGIGWRVYESDPSVTMLRMYARYATDTVNIRSISRLEHDVAAARDSPDALPAFVAIEPAMHHYPENDDHPPADMLRGQQFLQWVYTTLRSNTALWAETLLIITYDEHGGLYDHVVPPDADLLTSSLVMTNGSPHAAGGPRTIAIPYGVRVPTFVVSPWVQPGTWPPITLDHCSILKTVLARFLGDQKPFFGDRVNASQSFESFLTASSPRMDVPAPAPLPSLPPGAPRSVDPGQTAIDTPILTRKDMREKPTDYHALTGRLARMLGR